MFTYDERVGSRLFCDGLIALARELPIILVENDTGSALEANRFAEALPDRFVNCGIAEANSICISSGLSATGFIPVVHSHAPFITRRCYDQLYLSIGYAGQNCKVIGTTPGIYSELNGGTHLSIVDAAIMRDIPRFKVVDACDNVALEALLPQVMRDPDPTYFRLSLIHILPLTGL